MDKTKVADLAGEVQQIYANAEQLRTMLGQLVDNLEDPQVKSNPRVKMAVMVQKHDALESIIALQYKMLCKINTLVVLQEEK